MHIVAMSSGTLWRTPAADLLNAYVLDLVPVQRPKICYIGTAAGDPAAGIVSFYETFPADRYEPSHLVFFNRKVEDLYSFVLRQDAIYVSGGSTANLLAVWRLHGLDAILREAWQQGTVLFGPSAGGICWFEAGITDSFGPTLVPIDNCLGFLPGSFCPHYDSEPTRRSTYQQAVTAGLPGGWAADDGTALHFEGRELRQTVSALPNAKVYRVERVGDWAQERTINPDRLS